MTPDISTLRPVYLERGEAMFSTWHHKAKAGTLVEHVMHPDYWGNVGDRLLRTQNKGIGDVIRVVAEDGTFDLWLTVVEIDTRGLWARVRPLNLFYESQEPPQTVQSADYFVEFAGAHKWRIVARSGEVVANMIPTKEAAQTKLAEILREKLGAAA